MPLSLSVLFPGRAIHRATRSAAMSIPLPQEIQNIVAHTSLNQEDKTYLSRALIHTQIGVERLHKEGIAINNIVYGVRNSDINCWWGILNHVDEYNAKVIAYFLRQGYVLPLQSFLHERTLENISRIAIHWDSLTQISSNDQRSREENYQQLLGQAYQQFLIEHHREHLGQAVDEFFIRLIDAAEKSPGFLNKQKQLNFNGCAL